MPLSSSSLNYWQILQYLGFQSAIVPIIIIIHGIDWALNIGAFLCQTMLEFTGVKCMVLSDIAKLNHAVC